MFQLECNWFSQAGETILTDWGTPLLHKKNFPLDGKARQAKSGSQLISLPGAWLLMEPILGVQFDKKNFSSATVKRFLTGSFLLT